MLRSDILLWLTSAVAELREELRTRRRQLPQILLDPGGGDAQIVVSRSAVSIRPSSTGSWNDSHQRRFDSSAACG